MSITTFISAMEKTSNFAVRYQLRANQLFQPKSHLRLFRKISILFIVLTISGFVFSADKVPMKYGKIDKEDLSMTVYQPDTSASAVVLCDYGYYNSTQHQFVHQIRIKILKEEGKSNGNFYVPAAEKTNVKGQTVNVENGVPVVTKLGKEGIFIEKVTRHVYRARVAMPNVKVGSVIDVEFYFNGIPRQWNFQSSIPIRWSELVLEDSPYVSFKKNFVGFVPFAESDGNRWVIKNVPAFVPESYVNSIDNYITKVDFELESIHIPGYVYENFATSWETVVSKLNSDNDFGLRMEGLNLFLNGMEKKVKSLATTPYDRMCRAFELMKSFKWNENKSIWISEDGLETVFSKHYGNVSDINLSLVILLRKLGVTANPIVLSSRDNGTLPRFGVSMSKLNYVVVQAVIDDKTYFLDATEEYLPVDMLPDRALNERGLMLLKSNFLWVDLIPQKKDKEVSVYNVALLNDGSLIGDCSLTKYDYAALDYRKRFKSFNSKDEFLKSLEDETSGLSVEEYNVQNFDSLNSPVSEILKLNIKNYANKVNNQLYVSPIVFGKFSENPFKSETRLYPVDFAKPIDKKSVFMLEIPEGYAVEQLPKSIKMSLPDNSASFQMQASQMGNKVQVLFKYNINKPIYYQPEYNDLRTFFDQLVKKQSEMLVLKKI